MKTARSIKIRNIPTGPYCYTINRISKDAKSGMPIVETKTCPYWRGRTHDGELYGHCRLLKRGDQSSHNPTYLLFDKCKECGIKTNT